MPVRVQVRFEDPVNPAREGFEEPLVDQEHLEVFREGVTRLLGELALLETLDEDARRERVDAPNQVQRHLGRLVSRAGLRLDVEELSREEWRDRYATESREGSDSGAAA